MNFRRQSSSDTRWHSQRRSRGRYRWLEDAAILSLRGFRQYGGPHGSDQPGHADTHIRVHSGTAIALVQS